jgi:hypothetical protein
MKRATISLMFCVLPLFLLPCSLAAQYEHPDLKSGKKIIKNIVVLPPSASLMKSGMKGNEPLVAESQALELGLSSIVRETLSAKGCNIVQDAFSPAALDQNPELKYALSDLQTRYDKMQVLLNKKPKDVRAGRYSLGDEVANFSPSSSADALVFVRAKGFVTTAGKKAFIVLTGMGVAYNHVALDISIVDAQSGAVLYFAKPGSYGNFVGNPSSMKKAIDKSLSGLEIRTALKK